MKGSALNLRLLRIFQQVAREESITQAADKLFISQPAVSNAINQLEQHLGVELFDRLSRRIYLNEAGRQFLSKVEGLLALYDELEDEAKQLSEVSEIRVGSSITIANFILPQAIQTFQSRLSNEVVATVANAREIERQLVANQLDLGLIEGVIQSDDLISQELSSYHLGVFCSPDHPQVGKSIRLASLMNERWLLRESGSAIRSVFDSALLLENLRVTPSWTSINSHALIKATKQGLGITVLPKVLVEEEITRGELVELKVKGIELRNVNHLVYHKDKRLSPAMKTLIDCLFGVNSN